MEEDIEKRLAEHRGELATVSFCASYLSWHGFLTDAERDRIYKRINKYQDENEIEISEAQMLSVDITYNDNAKDEDYG